jgi:hypothetical protein
MLVLYYYPTKAISYYPINLISPVLIRIRTNKPRTILTYEPISLVLIYLRDNPITYTVLLLSKPTTKALYI